MTDQQAFEEWVRRNYDDTPTIEGHLGSTWQAACLHKDKQVEELLDLLTHCVIDPLDESDLDPLAIEDAILAHKERSK